MSYSYLIFILFVSSVNAVNIPNTNYPYIDAIIHEIKQELRSPEESPCLEDTVLLLENVKNYTLWATWVWNANLLPSGNMYASWIQLGNFDQCMKPPWLTSNSQFRSQYCIADVKLTNDTKQLNRFDPYSSAEEYIKSPTRKLGYPLNRIHWGVCMPSSCQPHSIASILKVMYQRTSFGPAGPHITVDHCQKAGTQQQYTFGFFIFIALIVTLIVLVAASTYYRSYVTSNEDPDSLETLVTKSFCLVKNCQDLVKQNKEEIRVMNGMRFITAAIIVFIHEIFYILFSGLTNTLDYVTNLEGTAGLFVHFDIVVDTFLVMSGLLHIKGLLANPERQKNLFLVLWKRYLRLIGPFAVSIFYLTAVAKYTGSGPLWHRNTNIETEVCLRTWRLSLIMLNSNPKDLCHAVTWYLSCDYQLTILGTVLFFFYKKDRKLGFTAFGTAVVFSLIIPGGMTYWYQLHAIHFLNLGELLHSIRDNVEFSYTYTTSYSRAGSYLVGIALGYIMTLYKPSNYRNRISKKWSIIGTAMSILVMIYVMSLGHFFLERDYSSIEHVVAAVTNRVAWAVGVSCIIGLCEYGSVPLVSNFLGLSVFTPLSRLSYGIYVIHTILIQRKKFTLRSPEHYDLYNFIMDTIGTLTASIVLSFLMWVLVEAPAINLSNNLVFNRSKNTESKKPEKNGIQKENGALKTKFL